MCGDVRQHSPDRSSSGKSFAAPATVLVGPQVPLRRMAGASGARTGTSSRWRALGLRRPRRGHHPVIPATEGRRPCSHWTPARRSRRGIADVPRRHQEHHRHVPGMQCRDVFLQLRRRSRFDVNCTSTCPSSHAPFSSAPQPRPSTDTPSGCFTPSPPHGDQRPPLSCSPFSRSTSLVALHMCCPHIGAPVSGCGGSVVITITMQRQPSSREERFNQSIEADADPGA